MFIVNSQQYPKNTEKSMWLKTLLVIVASYLNCETIATCIDQIASYNGNTTLLSYMSKRNHNEEKDLPRNSINFTRNCLYFYIS